MIVTDVEYDAMDSDHREMVKRVVITQRDPVDTIKKYLRVRELDFREYGAVSHATSICLLVHGSNDDFSYWAKNPRKVFLHPDQCLTDTVASGFNTVVCGVFVAGDVRLLTKNVKCDTLMASLDDPIPNVKAKKICFQLQLNYSLQEFRVDLDDWLSKCANVEYEKVRVEIPHDPRYALPCWEPYFVGRYRKRNTNVYELPWSRYVDDQEFHELFE